MILLQYKIRDELGIHARPAGNLVKKAREFASEITIEKANKNADAKKLMSVMSLGIRFNDLITLKISGVDEKQAAEEMEKFLEENL